MTALPLNVALAALRARHKDLAILASSTSPKLQKAIHELLVAAVEVGDAAVAHIQQSKLSPVTERPLHVDNH